MSIIERAAKFIDPVDDNQADNPERPSTITEAPDSIERAVGERLNTPVRAEPEGLAVWRHNGSRERRSGIGAARDRGAAEAPTESANKVRRVAGSDAKTDRIIKIDREHLYAKGTVQPDGARTPVAECFRLIKSQLLTGTTKVGELASGKAIMVTSALPGEGKTFCAVNLAISLALEKDRGVLLVDGDVANPSVPGLLGIAPEAGLMDALLDRSIDVEQLVRKTDVGRLSLLQAGTPHQHATELLASDAMRLLVQGLCERHSDQIVIFDSPPLLLASEAGVLANHMAQIILVVEAGRTPKQALEDALNRIDTRKVAGLVLNKGRGSRRGYGYGPYS